MHRLHNNRGAGGGGRLPRVLPMPITPNCAKQEPNFRYEFNMRDARRLLLGGGYGGDKVGQGVYRNRFTGSGVDELSMGELEAVRGGLLPSEILVSADWGYASSRSEISLELTCLQKIITMVITKTRISLANDVIIRGALTTLS